jgi:tripartite-type tricarboxylate transporter receptor subunit TctC
MKRHMLVALAAGAALSLAVSNSVLAQAYPTEPINIVVPLATGGTADTVARTVGEKVSKALGKPVVVNNKPGGSMVIGTQVVANAPANGYTLLVNTATSVIVPHLMPKLTYDIHKDFVPVTVLASNPHILVVNANVPANTLKEFIAWAKTKNGGATYASFGNGSSGHLGTELFKKAAKIEMLHVPYKGGGPATIDLLGGQVDAMLSDVPLVMSHIKTGKLKAIAIASESRSPLLPNVPTFNEAGVPNFVSKSWFGLMVRAATPDAIVNRLNTEFVKALRDPAVKEKLAAVGVDAIGNSREQFAELMSAEAKKYEEAVKFSGARLD